MEENQEIIEEKTENTLTENQENQPMKNAEIMPTDTNALVLPSPRNT